MFDLGIQELIVIFVVALIVFGPKRLPELGRTLGKGILELRKALEGVKEQIHAEAEMTQEAVGSAKPEEEKKETGSEAGVGPEATQSSPETKGETDGVPGTSDTEKFYRNEDEKDHVDRKEDHVDGR